ncbi:MlaA family lipoprotein [Thetidibacter halocola]|uniref:VacJ family lipoprotein n=1 Tax=Thetidibacter halocola TaxID=2827239 RepID=A0A8J7WBT3_9RHOB|nr:VacJ family lipoprotein [Thetidibacter halocola]MBS0124640.1 VacJ family lipoprotein [Thetidibacter halocola]
MRAATAFFPLVLAAALAGCSVPGPGEAPDGVWDPNEAANRRVHEFNLAVDRTLISGAGDATQAVPPEVQQMVVNFADTVSLPKTVVNQVLQVRLGRAARNTLRFAVNATLGLGGLFDLAKDIGLPQDESTFGETLYVWGLPEGGYVVLPVFGPSTERDSVGRAVDLFLNPLDYVLTPVQRRWKTGSVVTAKVIDRARYEGAVDSVLYESIDSYSQLRLIYLQNSRFDLGDTTEADGDAYIDPDAIDTEGF